MINWGQVIAPAIPMLVVLFGVAILSGILESITKKRRRKTEDSVKVIILLIIVFSIIIIIFPKLLLIIGGIILLILIINKKNKKIIKEENNKKEDNDNFIIKFKDPELTKQKAKEILEKSSSKEKPSYQNNITEDILTSYKPVTNKKNFYQLKQEWIKKGKEYEKFVGKYFEKQGYFIKYNGIEKGKKDNSIDIIAMKKEEVIFIQCKNWKENGKYKISHKDIKAFIGDTHTFIKENSQYKNYKIKRLFVISGKILDKSAYAYIKEHQDTIRYLLLKM